MADVKHMWQWGAREGGHLGTLRSWRMPGDHKQPLSLKEGCKNSTLEAVRCPSEQSSYTLTPSTSSWACSHLEWAAGPRAARHIHTPAKGEAASGQNLSQSYPTMPWNQLLVTLSSSESPFPELLASTFSFRTFLQHNRALSAGNNSN